MELKKSPSSVSDDAMTDKWPPSCPTSICQNFWSTVSAWSAGKRKGSSDTCETTSVGKKNIYPEGPQKNYAIRKPLSKVYLHRGRHWLTLLKQTSRSSKDLWPPLSSCDYHYPKAILIHLVSDESTSTINKRQADSKGICRNMEFILLSDILGLERIYSLISWAPKHEDLTSIFVVVTVLFFFFDFFCMFAWLICLMPFSSPFSHQVQSDYWLSLIDLNVSVLLWLN